MAQYKERIADKLLEYRLEEMGAVLIEGPKWCGKTTTAEQHAGSVVFLSDPEMKRQYLQLAETNSTLILEGAVPRLIDEWQVIPMLWDAVRHTVDRRRAVGQFILTGSAVPPGRDSFTHTGTGRFAWLTMRPMSLWESGDSSGAVSLSGLFSGKQDMAGSNSHDLAAIAYLLCRGGWPASVGKSRRVSLQIAYNYYEAVVKSDVPRVDETLRDSERVRALMRAYARHQGTQTPVTVLLDDINGSKSHVMSINTLHSYISALEQIFVIEDMKAWNPNLRSKTAIRTTDTRYFVDPSIGVAALGIGPDDLLNDLETFGLLFETMCVRDLRVYAESIGGSVFHYRDKSGLECDAVIHLRNGAYGLVEIKIGGDTAIAHGVETLNKLRDKIDVTRMKSPSFMMILTAVGQYAYRRSDGVWIVPIGSLRD